MDFKAKKRIFDKLFHVSHLDADRELLRKLTPANQLLKARNFNSAKTATDILYELIEFASEEEIVKNRREIAFRKANPISDPNPNPGGTGTTTTPGSGGGAGDTTKTPGEGADANANPDAAGADANANPDAAGAGNTQKKNP